MRQLPGLTGCAQSPAWQLSAVQLKLSAAQGVPSPSDVQAPGLAGLQATQSLTALLAPEA